MNDFETFKSWIRDVEGRYGKQAFSSFNLKYLDGSSFDDYYSTVFNGNDPVKMQRNRFRTPFQLERDRILYSSTFQRLADKTQLFTTEAINLTENRLTHSLKVMQISRSIARGLKLNEDLVETIALGHDVGHPPFAHIGEEALEEWATRKLGKKQLILGGKFPIVEDKTKKFFTIGNDPGEKYFLHGRQGFRILTLKRNSDYLRFSKPVMYGIWRHSVNNFEFDKDFKFNTKIEGKEISLSGSDDLTYEAQIVRYADDIAWVVSDLEEAFNNDILNYKDISPIIRNVKDRSETFYLRLSNALTDPINGSELLTLFISDIIENNLDKLENSNDKAPFEIKFSSDVENVFNCLKKYIKEKLHNKYFMARGSQMNKARVISLCDWYFEHPKEFLNDIKNKMNTPTFPIHLKINKASSNPDDIILNYSDNELYEYLISDVEKPINRKYKISTIMDFVSVLTDHEISKLSETMP
ncbi:MAG: HD domain-containing protein [Caldisericia bacterium]|nr:HD domain-containing protein [Caldisericia bacterium]MDD5689477.1 HD domain-containing protein [Caldisericia bacterium]